jgi:PIN domain nuclease of toxin-antitoxin system
MTSLVVDTHRLIWYLTDPHQLSVDAEAALDEAESSGGSTFVSAITLVEVRYLIDKGKMTEEVFEAIQTALQDKNTSIRLASLNLSIANTIQQVAREQIPDMPDRIIAATALRLNLPLVTCDEKILASDITTIW